MTGITHTRPILQGMVCVWYVYGMCMVCVWHVYGMCMVCVWYVYGSKQAKARLKSVSSIQAAIAIYDLTIYYLRFIYYLIIWLFACAE